MTNLKSFLISMVFLAVNTHTANASPPDVIDIHKLLYESSLVVVGQIARRHDIASDEVDEPRFTIEVHQVIAGPSVGGTVDVYPAYPPNLYNRAPTPPIGQNEYGMFFLTAGPGNKYSFTEAAYPDLPAPVGVPAIAEQSNNPLARIASVLSSDFVQAQVDETNLASQRVFHTTRPLPGDSIYNASYLVLSEIPGEVVIPRWTKRYPEVAILSPEDGSLLAS